MITTTSVTLYSAVSTGGLAVTINKCNIKFQI